MNQKYNAKFPLNATLAVVFAIVLMALVSINIHGPMDGALDSFPLK